MTENSGRLTDAKPAHASLGLVDGVGDDPTTETYHALHDWTSDGPLPITVIEAVAAVTGGEPIEIEPLHS